MRFFSQLASIFFDREIGTKHTPEPRDLTGHYQEELSECFLDGVFVACPYNDIKISIEAYKYHSQYARRKELAQLLVPILAILPSEYRDEVVVVPIPMHWSRYMIRGFDHMRHLSRALAHTQGLAYAECLLAGFSPRQSRLSKERRLKNRKERYRLKNGVKVPKTILLVDDVISTGSTANACARILKAGGALRVYGAFVASNQ